MAGALPPEHVQAATHAALSLFDIFAGGVASIVATILYAIRHKNGRGNEPGQWFADALTVGTIVVLAAIALYYLFGDLWGIGEVAKANMLLVALAFLYSGGVLIRNVYRSCQAAA